MQLPPGASLCARTTPHARVAAACFFECFEFSDCLIELASLSPEDTYHFCEILRSIASCFALSPLTKQPKELISISQQKLSTGENEKENGYDPNGERLEGIPINTFHGFAP